MKRNQSLAVMLSFVAFIFLFAAAFFASPDQAFSEEENRSLRTLPRLSWERLASGAYADTVNEYFADQFPLRNGFVGLKGLTELTLLHGENNGILLGKNGRLAQRLFDAHLHTGECVTDTDCYDPATLDAAGEGLARATNALDVPFTVLLTGRAIDVASADFSYPAGSQSDAMRERIKRAAGDRVDYLDTVPMLRAKSEAGEDVYFKTDHHWTARGAYYAYTELMKRFSMEDQTLPESAFTKQTVSENFYGTAWSAGGMKFVPSDKIAVWLHGNEESFLVTEDGKEGSLYRWSYLSQKDQYSIFPCGTHDMVTVIQKTERDRPVLLMVKDSFANALAPFLAQHFDLVIYNLSSSRADYTNLTALAKSCGADRVLLVYTLENVITTDKLSKLR